jgi:uncharacterized protein with von Willebrand factor type A (vWA) domain
MVNDAGQLSPQNGYLRPAAGLVEFARRLRSAGVPLGSDEVITYCRAVGWAGVDDLDDLYWAGRACLITSGEQIPVYDEIFDAVFRDRERLGTQSTSSEVRYEVAPAVGTPEAGDDRGDGEESRSALLASRVEGLRDKDFSKLSLDERLALESAIARLRVSPPSRRSRRTTPVRRGGYPDLRKSIRRSMRTQGEIINRSWRDASIRPRRLVLLLDVSKSMSAYARALLFFAHALRRADAKVEIFCFGTKITRVTESLRRRDPDAALAAVTAEVTEWDGGTRIGASLEGFMRGWGRAGLARDSLLLICSDGLECDDPATLGAHMERLSRLAYKIVWVNPLKGDSRYQPLARGMAAALPYIDHFVTGHNLASLEDLTAVLKEIG